MVQLWRLYQGGGMGAGYLPDAGGAIDQPAAMMAAFALMNQFEAMQKADDAPPYNEDGDIDHQEIGRRTAAAFGVTI
jgi:hypothetical protein